MNIGNFMGVSLARSW